MRSCANPESRDPQRLEAWAVEQLVHQPIGDEAQTARDRAGEPLLRRRERLLELGLDVDGREERIGQACGDGLTDRRIGDQLLGGLLELVGVERLPDREVGRDEDGDEDHAENDEHARDIDPPPFAPGRAGRRCLAHESRTSGGGHDGRLGRS